MLPLARELSLLALLALLGGCSSTRPAASSADWSFEKEAVQLKLSSDKQLNLYHNTPHALVSCLYQLRDPNGFSQLASESGGLEKLLECGRFDASVATAKRLVLQPQQKLEELLDRAEGARYLGYVAGYYQLQKERVLRLVNVPVVETESGLFTKTKSVRPAKLTLQLRLDPKQIADPGSQDDGGTR